MDSQDIMNWTQRIREELHLSLDRVNPDGILFSGGLDSAILAALKPEIKAISVSLQPDSEDAPYVGIMKHHFNLEHHPVTVSEKEAIDAIPDVIKILKSFDPAIPNDLAVYFGLMHAGALQCSEIMTGDGSDELFAGYTYMASIKNIENYLERINRKPVFNANRLGKQLGIRIAQPYLHKDFKRLALDIPVQFKIRKRNRQSVGKWILRKAFEHLLPSDITWQGKRPLEVGSGMTRLRKIIGSQITDRTFQESQKESGIHFYSKDHLYYYNIYREVVGEIPRPVGSQVPCPSCGAGTLPEKYHCYTCGFVFPSPSSGQTVDFNEKFL